ncbi:MAG: hypothetical protein WDM89_16300 [Rhizomicrobium sp.]
MPQEQIFFPMGALALLTFLVLTLIPIRRFRAGFAGRIVPEDFRLGESANVPSDVSIPNRAYMNLLEMPLLFCHLLDAVRLRARGPYVSLPGMELCRAADRSHPHSGDI